MCSSDLRETGLSEPTIVRHLEIMSQTYVLHVLPSYSTNLANELKKSKKYYLFDTGIRNALLKDMRPVPVREDKGPLLESAVMLHLVSRLLPNMELRFWRTKKGDEVDFVLVKNRIPVPIEVKSDLKKVIIPRGMIQFLKRYPKAPCGIVYNTEIDGQVATVAEKPVYFKKWTDVCRLEYLQGIN